MKQIETIRVLGGSLSLWQNRGWGDYCDFPRESIGFCAPFVEGGVLVCFMKKEPNRNHHIKTWEHA